MSRLDKCTIDGCSTIQHCRGMCRMHYTRWQRHGDPQVRLKNSRPKSFQEVFGMHVPSRPEGSCWIWQGSIDKNGYGQYNTQGSPKRAHRLVYEHLIGPIPADKLLMHSCDNPPCVNPAHLTPGTDAENLADMARKGRSARGSRHRAAKLTEAQVMEARSKYASGKYTLRMLANEYGLTMTPVSQLVRGVTWKHLPLVERTAA